MMLQMNAETEKKSARNVGEYLRCPKKNNDQERVHGLVQNGWAVCLTEFDKGLNNNEVVGSVSSSGGVKHTFGMGRTAVVYY